MQQKICFYADESLIVAFHCCDGFAGGDIGWNWFWQEFCRENYLSFGAFFKKLQIKTRNLENESRNCWKHEWGLDFTSFLRFPLKICRLFTFLSSQHSSISILSHKNHQEAKFSLRFWGFYIKIDIFLTYLRPAIPSSPGIYLNFAPHHRILLLNAHPSQFRPLPHPSNYNL